jgi:hypothetical protein
MKLVRVSLNFSRQFIKLPLRAKQADEEPGEIRQLERTQK